MKRAREGCWQNSTIERMILQWWNANGEWIKRDRREQNGNNAARYYFLFAASDRPPTRNHGVHPPLIHPGILQWRGHNFRVLMRCSLTVTALYLCFPIPFPHDLHRSRTFRCFTREPFSPVTNNLPSRDRLWDIPSASESYVADAVTRRKRQWGANRLHEESLSAHSRGSRIYALLWQRG